MIADPQFPEDITPEWTSKVLGTQVSSKDFIIESNIQAGSGFLSNMVRLSCKSVDGQTDYRFIIKLLPKGEEMRGLVISEKFDKTEINFYQKVAPELMKICPDLREYLCHSYYGNVREEEGFPYTSVLVMEDLKPQGYYTINFAEEESPEQIQEVLEFMAKFHYAGLLLEKQQKKKLPEIYPFLAWFSEKSLFYEMGKAGFAGLNALLMDHGVSKDVADMFQELTPYSDKIIKLVEAASKEFPCLIHGDLWSNNLLFNHSPQYHTKVIDWQILGYKDPSYDVAVTIVSSLPKDQLTKETTDKYFREYYDMFVKICKERGHPDLVTRTWDQFLNHCNTFGMSFTLLWFLMASEPFALNYPRLMKIYEFLANEVKVPEFVLSQVQG